MTALFYQGHAIDVLKEFPDDFFHCCVTSPPYWGLRSYAGEQETTWPDGWSGALGAEPSPELYIQHLVEVFREVKRVLRPDGVFWLNISDSYAGSNKGLMADGSAVGGSKQMTVRGSVDGALFKAHPEGLKPLDKCLIPFRLAIALQTDGWWVRQDCIWAKFNPMPASVDGWRWERHKIKVQKAVDDWRVEGRKHDGPVETAVNHVSGGNTGFQNPTQWIECEGCPQCSPHGGYVLRKGNWRPTTSHEYIFMLTKSDSYYCDKYAVTEPVAIATVKRGKVSFGGKKGREYNPDPSDPNYRNGSDQWGKEQEYHDGQGRNLRSVWSFPTKPFGGDHYAAYPPTLPATAIKASTSEKGHCPKCGSPWVRVIKKGLTDHTGQTDSAYETGMVANRLALLRQAARERGEEYHDTTETVDWKPTCTCNRSPIPARVLDPFSGAGTTALAAELLGRSSWNVDISSKYIEIAERRVADELAKAQSTKPTVATKLPEHPIASPNLSLTSPANAILSGLEASGKADTTPPCTIPLPRPLNGPRTANNSLSSANNLSGADSRSIPAPNPTSTPAPDPDPDPDPNTTDLATWLAWVKNGS